jgi:hypothetical protein
MSEKSEQNKRRYYSQRTGNKNAEIDLAALSKIFLNIYQSFSGKQYFDEYFGKGCPDNIDEGKIAGDPGFYILRTIRKDNLWPIWEKYQYYSEEDLFDMIEFLFDHVSCPLEENSFYHTFNACGRHYRNFDAPTAKEEYITEINEFLNDYSDGYELTSNGEICVLLQEEFRPLLSASIPTDDPENIETRMKVAVDKFRRYRATLDEKRDAVRSLADCLEFLRPDLKKVLDKDDDGALFNIINNFDIRHHNHNQKKNYDKGIWLNWMFYFYLATLHAGLRFLGKQKNEIA